jgi:DNA uptake protein ComE-like DNA-binding protein
VKGLLVSLLLAVFAAQGQSAEPAAPKPAKVPSAELKALAATLNPAQTNHLLIVINGGDRLALGELPGIGPVRAAAIERSRPFTLPLDLLRVSGIGEATLTDILNHAKSGFPKTAPKAKRSK